MTNDPKPPLNPATLRANLGEAQALLTGFAEGPARQAADAVSSAFERAGARIASSLGRAAQDGEVNIKRLAKTILEELAKIALPAALDRIGLGGAAAPSQAGRSFAPFSPSASGANATAPVTIALNIAPGADAEGILRHRGQIAAEIARAVAYGRRNL